MGKKKNKNLSDEPDNTQQQQTVATSQQTQASQVPQQQKQQSQQPKQQKKSQSDDSQTASTSQQSHQKKSQPQQQSVQSQPSQEGQQQKQSKKKQQSGDAQVSQEGQQQQRYQWKDKKPKGDGQKQQQPEHSKNIQQSQPPQSTLGPKQGQQSQQQRGQPQSAWGPKQGPQPQRPASQSQQQREKQQTGPRSSTSGVSVSSLSSSMKKLSIVPYNAKIPIETSPDGRVYEGKKGRKCKVQVNYGTISFDPKKFPQKAYHYDISFDPNAPKKMLPFALRAFMTNYFRNYLYGTDERSNLYTSQKLAINGTDIEVYTNEAKAVMGDRTRDFKVTIKFAREVDLGILLNYQNPKNETLDQPATAVQVLDIILRSAFNNLLAENRAVRAGRQVFFVPPKQMPLGDGMELWYGLFQSAILGRSRLYLNVDVLHKAFPSQMLVLDYLASICRDGRVPQRLDERSGEFRQLKEFLSMLSIQYRTKDNEPFKTYGVNGLIGSSRQERFEQDGRSMSVEEYYRNFKNINLRFPDLPCLWVGSRQRRIALPMEFCYIPPGQATNKKCSSRTVAEIIRYSATTTDDRKRKILDLLRQINYANDPTVSGFGIRVDPNFQDIDARVISPPQLEYKGEKLVTPRNGVWREETYARTNNQEINWAIVNCDDRTNNVALENLKNNIVSEARRQNINLRDIRSNDFIRINAYQSRNLKQDLENIFEKCKNNACQLVIVIIIDQKDCYARVKQAAELRVGILTQCIKANTIFRMGKGNPMMTIKNILLKLNSKLNGTNHMIREESYNTFNAFNKNSGVMFIGADVTHPSPDAKDIPSVVGVASSHDDVGFRYCCAWRLQDPTKEMIVDLEEIVAQHLHFYKEKNKKLPGKIMYYRDGVSEGQFRQVLDIEMTAIRNAMRRIYGTNQPAQVTFIVVQKRHHTRFFPLDPNFTEGKFKNISPGTVVDKDIMHPFQYQFFMASHAAIQGVTKPTKYCILINESKIDPDVLQAITYSLCHLFTRCNRAVSYPAPTYYAHLVAARGKNYIVGERLNMGNLQKEFNIRQIRPEFNNNTPMFFV